MMARAETRPAWLYLRSPAEALQETADMFEPF
jgi:hypothetical protein